MEQPPLNPMPTEAPGFAVSDLKRLIATGNEVTFADETVVRIRFSARTMASVEDRYGSLDAFMTELNAATGGKFYHHIAWVFAIVTGMTEDQIWDRLDTTRVMDYFKAIAAALLEAMPAPEGSEGNGLATPGSRSPGVATSGSRSSSGTSNRKPSGT